MNRASGARDLGCALALAVMVPTATLAGQGDVTLLGGLAFPTYAQQFTLTVPVSPLPGLEIRAEEDLTLDARGGAVFGGAVAFAFTPVIAIEGRLDSTALDLRSSGARYVFEPTSPLLSPLTGTVTIGSGTIAVDRLTLLSLNLRLRSPGPLGVYASGGLSYLPGFSVSGTIPVRVDIAGIPSLPGTDVGVRLLVAPTDSAHRFGVNAGAGIRIRIAPSVSLVGEGRVFYFKEYELLVDETDIPFLGEFLNTLGLVRFEPVVVNVVGGIAISF